MTHAEAVQANFLAAIIAEPDDDALRLIYADWLQDHGQPERAEFVRVQVESAALVQGADEIHCPACGVDLGDRHQRGCRYLFLWNRERELLAIEPSTYYESDPNKAMGWCGGTVANHWGFMTFQTLPHELLWRDRLQREFRRGFVESVTLSAADFYEHAAALFRAAPITAVRLADLEPSRMPNGGGFCWISGMVGETTHWVRQDLFQCLPLWMGQYAMTYPTAEAAHAALSQACVTFGRKAAGGGA